jgi:hypothetical protein
VPGKPVRDGYSSDPDRRSGPGCWSFPAPLVPLSLAPYAFESDPVRPRPAMTP